jgi:hypothetical protein
MLRGLVATLTVAVLVTGCGGDDDADSAADGELARLVPADTFLYLEGTARPEGEQLEAVEAVAARFPGGDQVGERIIESLDEQLSQAAAGEAAYTTDIEPWLGERVAFFYADPEQVGSDGSDAEPIYLLETTDAEAALDALPRLSEEATEEGTYGDVEYVTSGEDAGAVVDDLVVLAPSLEQLEQVIDVANGDAGALADSENFSYEVGDVDGAEALAYASLDLQAAVDAWVASDELASEQGVELAENLGYRVDTPLRMALTATSDAVELHTSVAADLERLPGGDGGFLGEVPADASAASVCAGCVQVLFALFEAGFEQSAISSGVSADDAEQLLERTFGVTSATLPDTVGDVAYFVRPGGRLGVEAGAIAEILDQEAAEHALNAARAVIASSESGEATIRILPADPSGAQGFTVLAPDLPAPITVLLADGRLALGLGAGVAEDALAPESTLADAGRIAEAEEALGDDEEPTAIVSLDELLAELESLAGEDPEVAEVLPYLEPIALIAAGVTESDGEQVSSIVATLD